MAAAAFHDLALGTAPATADSGFVRPYCDSNGRLCTVDNTPTTRVFVDRASTETLSAKKFDSTCTDVDASDATKVIAWSQSGMTTGVTLTLSTTQSTSQTLNFPNITATDTLVVTTLAQTLTNKTLTSPTINAYTITGTGTIANGCTLTTPAIAGAAITGTVTIGAGCTLTTPNIGAATGTSVVLTGAISSSSPSAGIGYATGAGTAQTQSTSKATTVSANALCGTIVMNGAALANATTVSFTFTNTSIAANDVVLVVHDSVGTLGAYTFATTPAAGSCLVSVRNVHTASLSEAIKLRFIVIKAVVA